MASGGFPQRKSQGAGGMTEAGGPGGSSTSVLDGPPPSPAMGQAQPLTPGQPAPMPSFAEMAAPMTAGTPGRALTPELQMGLLESAATIYGMLDSMASIAPDLANDFAVQKDLLQRTLAKLVVNGGPAPAAGATGLNFPGGGFSSGSR